MSRVYSYVVQHDLGFAPNPFMGACTLANCKPKIRQVAKCGDLIIGTGSIEIRAENRLVYWMRVGEVTTFDEYWKDARFSKKKPIMNGSLMQQYGDNIYWVDANNKYQQLDSFHSESDGSVSIPNLERDTGTTANVLIADEFAYFGKNALRIPEALLFMVKSGPGHKCNFEAGQTELIKDWVFSNPSRGYLGEPGRW